MTANHPVPTPPPAEPAPSLRPVEELQALCDAATPGPWITKNDDVIGPDGMAVAVVCDSWDGNARRFDDRDFIAAARTALPLLLARLRAAEETLAAVGALAEDEIGPDLAPRITELLAALSAAPQPEPDLSERYFDTLLATTDDPAEKARIEEQRQKHRAQAEPPASDEPTGRSD